MERNEFLQDSNLRAAVVNAVETLDGPIRLTQRGDSTTLYGILHEAGVMPAKGKDENGKDPSSQPLMKMREALRSLSLPYTNKKGGVVGQTEGYTSYGVAAGHSVSLGTEIYAVPVNQDGVYDADGEVEVFDGENLPEGTPTTKKVLKEMHLDTIGVSGFTFSPDWLRNTQDFPGVGEVTGAEFVALAGMNKGSNGKGKPSSIAGIRLNTQPQPETEEVDGDGSAES